MDKVKRCAPAPHGAFFVNPAAKKLTFIRMSPPACVMRGAPPSPTSPSDAIAHDMYFASQRYLTDKIVIQSNF